MPEESPLLDGVLISSMKVVELREALKKRGLPPHGLKHVLVNRLKNFISGRTGECPDSPSCRSTSTHPSTSSQDKSTEDNVENDHDLTQNISSKSPSNCSNLPAPSAKVVGLVPCVFTTDGWGRPRLVGRFDGNILDGQYVRLVDFTVDPPHCISWKDPWTYFLCFAHPEPFPQLANTDLATDPEIPDNFPNFELPRSRNEITHVTDPYADSDYETEMLQTMMPNYRGAGRSGYNKFASSLPANLAISHLFDGYECPPLNERTQNESEDFRRHLISKLQNGPVSNAAHISACNGYPCLYISKMGFISVMVNPDVRIDVTVDRTMRVTCFGKFTATLCPDDNTMSLAHENASVYQSDGYVYSIFRTGGNTEKQAIIGDEGIIFTPSKTEKTYVLAKLNESPSSVIPIDRSISPPLERDFTARMFMQRGELGDRMIDLCHEFVSRAHFTNTNGGLNVDVCGIHIRQEPNDNIEISIKPRFIRFTPMSGAIQIRTPSLEMAVDAEGRGFVTAYKKRVHASATGLVVADDSQVATVDNNGKVSISA